MPTHGQANTLLPRQAISRLIDCGIINANAPIEDDQLQPASLDLRLGSCAFRVRASFLPSTGATVEERLSRLSMHKITLDEGAILERGCVYVIPLQEYLSLTPELSALANPKSSIGRLDVFTRIICDDGTTFDRIEAGYSGPLYAEVAPKTFSIKVRTNSRLNQIRFRIGNPTLDAAALVSLGMKETLIGPQQPLIMRGNRVGVTIDLRGDAADDTPIGYRAKRHTNVIDVDKRSSYASDEFWEPIMDRSGSLILDPDEFYILATREDVRIPPNYAGEMIPYDTFFGEFRVHYAGFFDPGFGWGEEGAGSRAVLEVRSHEVPFLVEHGQAVGWLQYEILSETPDFIYSKALGSSYQKQGLTLAKHFFIPQRHKNLHTSNAA